MLSFLYRVSDAAKQITTSLSHPWISTPKVAESYVMILLGPKGVKRASFLSKDEAREKHYFKKNDAVFAPVFYLENVLKLDDDDKRAANIRKQVLRSVDVLRELSDGHLPVQTLHQRLSVYEDDPLRFFDDVMHAIEETGEKLGKTVVVFLENYQQSGSDKKFFTSNSLKKLIDIFRKPKIAPEGSKRDIFGNAGEFVKVLPKVRAFGLTQFTPYSRNKNTGAYARYGLNSVSACPISEQSQQTIYDTLATLSDPQFRGKLWNCLRDSIREEKTHKNKMFRVTLVVPELPTEEDFHNVVGNLELLSLLEDIQENGQEETDEAEDNSDETENAIDNAIQQYKDLAEPVISALSGCTGRCPTAQYQIYVFHKPDKGSVINSAHQTISFSELVDRIQFWTAGVAAPRHRNFGYYAEGKRHIYAANEAIRPFDVYRVMNRCWKQNAGVGSNGRFINGYDEQISKLMFTFSDALEVFLHNDRKIAVAMLHHIARHHVWLLKDVATRDRHKQSCLLPRRRNHWRRDVLKLPGLISVLYRIQENLMSQEQVNEAVEATEERNKVDRDIMEMQTPYRMGQALAIADALYRLKFDSPSQYPSQFIGESMFSSFMNGTQVKEYWRRFHMRIAPLLSWSRPFSYKSDKELVKQPPKKKQIRIHHLWLKKMVDSVGEIPERFSPSDTCLFAAGFYSI